MHKEYSLTNPAEEDEPVWSCGDYFPVCTKKLSSVLNCLGIILMALPTYSLLPHFFLGTLYLPSPRGC